MRNTSFFRYLIATFCSAAAWLRIVAVLLLSAGFAYLNRQFFAVDMYETGDFAANSLLIQQAKQLHLLVGHYSRVGFNHPGPAILYVLAAGEWLFYDVLGVVKSPLAGQLIAQGAYNAFWIVMLGTLLMRMTRSIATAATAWVLILTATAYFDYNIFFGIWFPHLFYFPFATFTLALALLIAGRGDSLIILAVSCGFLIHGHVSFVAICGFMLLGALYINQRRAARDAGTPRIICKQFARDQRAELCLIGTLFVAFLSPLLLETVRDFPGPIAKYLFFSAGNHHNNPAKALQFAANYWNTGIVPLLLAVLALLFFAKTSAFTNTAAQNNRGPAAQALWPIAPTLLLATAALLLYALYGIDDLSMSYIGLFYYAAPAIGLAMMIASFLQGRTAAAKIVVAVLIAAAALPYTIRQIAKPVEYAPLYHNAAMPEYFAGLTALRQQGSMVLDLDTGGPGWGDIWSTLAGVEAYAARHDATQLFCIDKAWHILFGVKARCTPQQIADGTRYYVSTAPMPMQRAAALGNIGFFKIEAIKIPPGENFDVAGHRAFYAISMLQSGWSSPEGEFVWSNGEQATLIFATDRAMPTAHLHVDMAAFLHNANAQQDVDITVNDVAVGSVHFDAANNRSIRTFTFAADAGTVAVKFHIREPRSPHSVGQGKDRRALGIALYGLSIEE